MNGIRKRNIYAAGTEKPFRLSRSKIDLFLKCQRCFYLDRKLGVSQPSSPPFSLNIAVDALLKKEFDGYRKLKQPHPLCVQHNIDAVPFDHPEIEVWRDSLRKGITYQFPETNLLLTGGVDDVWINPKEELIIVDYKATSKAKEVTIDEEWQIAYKRQMEIYQWLFRMNGFKVHDTGYFVYCNGLTVSDRFDSNLAFSIKVIPYSGSDNWIQGIIRKLHECLNSDKLPAPAEGCEYCNYRAAAASFESIKS